MADEMTNGAESMNGEAMDDASQAVADNLEHAASTETLQGEVHATTEAHGGPSAHDSSDPTALLMNGTAWVSLAMLIFIGILIWKKVPGLIAKSLDGKIAEIKSQLDDAEKLRKDAEALKQEYQNKITSAEKDAVAMREAAQEEAAQILAQAKIDAADLITRRQKMAEDKIGAAERTAIAGLRAKAASAATMAAGALITEAHSKAADKSLVDDVIAKIGATH